MTRRDIPCTICTSSDHTAAGCDAPMADHIRYTRMAYEAIGRLGSESALCHQLGYRSNGVIYKRIDGDHKVKNEHVLALETLLERMRR